METKEPGVEKEPKVGEAEKIIKECCQYYDRIDKQINCRNDVIKQINQLIDSSRESAKRETVRDFVRNMLDLSNEANRMFSQYGMFKKWFDDKIKTLAGLK